MAGGTRSPLRAAVIGCGAIAEEHLTFLATSEQVELAAVCDLSPALADLARRRHGAGIAMTDVHQMLSDVEPEIVHVLTPPRTHRDLVRRALDRGAHVICEKPLAPTHRETAELLDAAASANRSLVETRNLLYNDVIARLDDAIAAGRVGTPREVDVSLALRLGSADVPPGGLGLPGGIVHDYLPHLAYLLLHLTGEDAELQHVTGTVDNLSGRPDIGFDHVDALITFAEIRSRLRITPDVRPDAFRVAVRGTDGALECDLYQPYLTHEGPPWTGMRAPLGMVAEGLAMVGASGRYVRDKLLQHGTYHGMPRMLADVYDALISGRPVPVSDSDMLASARLIDRVVDLAREQP